MKTYLATYGNGARRLFDATTETAAYSMAAAYGARHGCGALCNVTRW